MYSLCKCADSHPYGDPMSERGCWNCSSKCHSEASCVWPGRCECNRRFQGDGVTKCDSIPPVVVDINPDHGDGAVITLVNVSFLYPLEESEVIVQNAFCRFGQIPVKAKVLSKSSLQCGAPRRAPQAVDFAISFDGSVWSSEPVSFLYRARLDLADILPGLFLAAGVVAGLAVGVGKVANRKKDGMQDFEYAPFIPKRPRGDRQTKRRHEA
jgi:hypothetical protein